jgi:hypothetical protein
MASEQMTASDSLYCQVVSESEDVAGPDPVSGFLAQPAPHYDEDVARESSDRALAGSKVSVWRRLNHFLFEKSPSPYSSIAPRRTDGTRTKIFFFNGNGRGR